MVGDLLGLTVTTIVPGTALLIGIIFSLYEVYNIGEKRMIIIILILGFMLVHQYGELTYFLDTGAVRDALFGEIPETSANLIAAGSVY
jgi:hypothetical protein